MAGLYIKELMLRGDLERCLIVAPGGLVERWAATSVPGSNPGFQKTSSVASSVGSSPPSGPTTPGRQPRTDSHGPQAGNDQAVNPVRSDWRRQTSCSGEMMAIAGLTSGRRGDGVLAESRFGFPRSVVDKVVAGGGVSPPPSDRGVEDEPDEHRGREDPIDQSDASFGAQYRVVERGTRCGLCRRRGRTPPRSPRSRRCRGSYGENGSRR